MLLLPTDRKFQLWLWLFPIVIFALMVGWEIWLEPRVWHAGESGIRRLQQFLLFFPLIVLMAAYLLQRAAVREKRDLEELHQTIDTVPDLLFALDAKLRLVKWNHSMAVATGLSNEELLGRPALTLLAPEDRAKAAAGIARCLETGFAEEEAHLLARDGRRLIFHWNARLLRDEATGRVLGIAGSGRDISERKEMEAQLDVQRKQLEESGEKLRAIFDNALFGILVADVETRRYQFANSAACTMLGYTEDELLSLSVEDLHPRESLAALLEDFGKQAQGESDTLEPEAMMLRKDGSVFLAKFGINRLTLGGRQMLVGMFRDIDAERRTEKRLQDSERRFRDLLESAPDGFLMVDGGGAIRLMNRQVEELFGYTRGELIGKTVETLVPDKQAAVHAEYRLGYAQKPAHRRMGGKNNLYARRKDGREFPVEISLNPMRTNEGVVTLAAIRDVSERKLAEYRLAESERRFRQLAENVNEVFFIWDPHTRRILYVNPPCGKIWGVTPDVVYRRPWVLLSRMHPDDRKIVIDMIRRQKHSSDPQEEDRECRLMNPDGSFKWIWYRVFPIRDAANQIIRYGGVATDITGLKSAEEERMRYARDQRDNLVREVHHRIKNHLQGIIGLLDGYIQENPGLHQILEEAVTKVQAVALVHGLLGRTTAETVFFPQMVKAVLNSVRRIGPEGVSVEIAGSSLCITDENQTCHCMVVSEHAVPIALIVNELVTNAVKHSEGEPNQIGATLDCGPDWVELCLTNTGKLPAGVDFAKGRGLGTGLGLIRSLLPRRGANLEIAQQAGRVAVRLKLFEPVFESRNFVNIVERNKNQNPGNSAFGG